MNTAHMALTWWKITLRQPVCKPVLPVNPAAVIASDKLQEDAKANQRLQARENRRTQQQDQNWEHDKRKKKQKQAYYQLSKFRSRNKHLLSSEACVHNSVFLLSKWRYMKANKPTHFLIYWPNEKQFGFKIWWNVWSSARFRISVILCQWNKLLTINDEASETNLKSCKSYSFVFIIQRFHFCGHNEQSILY